MLAKELLPLKIRVNQIAVSVIWSKWHVLIAIPLHNTAHAQYAMPLLKCLRQAGIYPSQMTAGGKDDETHKSDLSGTGKGESLPAGRPGKEEDMAAAVLYLASYGGVL